MRRVGEGLSAILLGGAVVVCLQIAALPALVEADTFTDT